jgi:hypothetical protein
LWKPYRFLLGEWEGEGTGDPGKGAGSFTFIPDLEGKILVRRNHANYPAAGGRPAVMHEDLMVVYAPQGSEGPKAIYWDNEGHVIYYTLSTSSDGHSVTFLSEPVRGVPRFRLSYVKLTEGEVSIKFEIAPPGQPGGFKPYLEAKARRKGK